MNAMVRPAGPARPRPLVARLPRPAILALCWALQAALLYIIQAAVFTSQGEVDGPDGNMLGALPTLSAIWYVAIDPSFALSMGITLAVLTAAQAVFVWPLRRPGLSGTRGHSLRASLVVAGLAITVLTAGVIAAVYEITETFELGPSLPVFDFIDLLPGRHWTFLAVVLGPVWFVAARLLIAFVKPGPRETVLAKVANRLFAGTVIEIVLLIPLDVMIRRRTDCYCWAGTYWALTLCGFVGVFALGPAVFIPLLASRRKPWYQNHCGVCGYDLSATPDAPRCPECGTGWRTPAPTSTPA